MRVLLVNNYYDFGSTGKIVKDIRYYLEANGVDTFVAYGRGRKEKDPRVYKYCREIEAKVQGVYSILSGNLYGGSPFSTQRLISYIKRIKPDVVNIHCINAFSTNIPVLLDYLASTNIKTIVTHHAEFFYTGNCTHALDCNKWKSIEGCKDCIRKEGTGKLGIDMVKTNWRRMMSSVVKFDKNDLISIVVSPWVKNRIEQSPIWNKYSSVVVKNGIDTNVFRYRKDANIILPSLATFHQYKKICLHVTPRFTTKSSIKGGQFVFPIAESMPDVLFIIVSVFTEQGISTPGNVLLWGKAETQKELAALYSIANVTLLTSERETFSMVCAESLCCGTPVVGFKAGGPESISLREFSSFVDYGNVESLVEEIRHTFNNHFEHEEISKNSIPIFDRNTMGKEVLGVYNQIMNAK